MTDKDKFTIDTFFDMADKVVSKVEDTLKDAHYPDKVYDAPKRPPIEDAEIVSETKAPNAFLVRIRVELYTAIQRLKGKDLDDLRGLIAEIHTVLRLPNELTE